MSNGVDLGALYREHWQTMVRLATLVIGDQGLAEDVVQDVFAGAHRHVDRLEPDRVVGYLRTGVLNRARSAVGRRKPWQALLPGTGDRAPHGAAEPTAPEGAAVQADQERQVLAVLAELPQRQREVIVLRYWIDLSEAQIAQTLGITPGTVKSTASRAMKALSSQLGNLR